MTRSTYRGNAAAAALALAAAATLAACSSGGAADSRRRAAAPASTPASVAASRQHPDQPPAARKTIRLGFSVLSLTIPALQDTANALKAAGKGAGISVTVADPNFDVQTQIQQIEQWIQLKQVDAVWVIPIAAAALAPVIKQAQAAHIPILVDAAPAAAGFQGAAARCLVLEHGLRPVRRRPGQPDAASARRRDWAARRPRSSTRPTRPDRPVTPTPTRRSRRRSRRSPARRSPARSAADEPAGRPAERVKRAAGGPGRERRGRHERRGGTWRDAGVPAGRQGPGEVVHHRRRPRRAIAARRSRPARSTPAWRSTSPRT